MLIESIHLASLIPLNCNCRYTARCFFAGLNRFPLCVMQVGFVPKADTHSVLISIKSVTLLMNFASLGLAPELLHAIKVIGFKSLTPIQEQAIPLARRGVDLLATAQTGTGKTAAFSLPSVPANAGTTESTRIRFLYACWY